MTKNQKHICLLADFFNCDYYEAYDAMIRRLSPLFSIPYQNPRLIDRLDFRADLQRDDKGVIYAELARLLCSGTNVLRHGLTKNDLFRWLADERHTNLDVSFQTIQRTVNKIVMLYI